MHFPFFRPRTLTDDHPVMFHDISCLGGDLHDTGFISEIPGSHRGFRSDHFGFDEDELHTLQRQGSK